MFTRSSFALRRAATASLTRPMVIRRAAFSTANRAAAKKNETPTSNISMQLSDIKSEADVFGPGAKPGTVPTDLEQATGIERLEILGKIEGVDVFDMKPLDASHLGTLQNPIIARSFGKEHYVGCTGFPADSHVTMWMTLSKDRPIERCPECGNVIKMEYVGPVDDPHAHDHGHGHDHGGYEEPKTMADFVKPQYW